MKNLNPNAIVFRLAGGAAPTSPQAASPEPVRPQIVFFPISGATAPLKQN
jgi:hypothetical protein